MDRAALIETIGRLPLAGRALRWYANRYPEGSVTTIRSGRAAGMRWRRHHRYVNGYWAGQYELPMQDALARELREGDTFYDVGANAGFFTLIAARIVGPRGKCVAFDPSPDNAQSVREQIELNRMAHAHVRQQAIADRAGTMTFSFSTPGSPQARLGAGRAGDQSIEVQVTTLDAVMAEHGPPNFIKLDIEGAEVDAVRGAQAVLRDARPGWLIELHGPEKSREVKRVLAEAGYRFFEIDGRELQSDADLPHHVIARHGGPA